MAAIKVFRLIVKLVIFGGLMLGSSQTVSAEKAISKCAHHKPTIDELITTFMKQHAIDGITLAIVQAPYISRVVGYGYADPEKKLLASPKTLWRIGQITCGYTAVAIMQLVEENKFKIDDPIEKFIPSLPAAWQKITLRQLMGHASGLPDYMQQSTFDSSKNYSLQEVMASISSLPLAFQPGSQVSQSATNFFLLGAIIEKASGTSYEEYIKKKQIQPLGLKNTVFPSDISQLHQEDVVHQSSRHKQFLKESIYIDPTEVATGYSDVKGQKMPINVNPSQSFSAYDSLLASAEDISFWDIALAGSVLVKEKENRDIIYNAIQLNNGTKVNANCGWRFYAHKGLMSIHGNVPGFSTYLSRFTEPSELVCVTLCANKDNIDLTELARSIAGTFSSQLDSPSGPGGMRYLESCFDVKTTMDRLEEFLKAKGVHIMARVDHSAGASKANLELKPTETLIFGNPAMGTHLMLANPGIAVNLPLRVAVWQEEGGSVWLGYNDIRCLANSYGITGIDTTIDQMAKGLGLAAQYAVEPY